MTDKCTSPEGHKWGHNRRGFLCLNDCGVKLSWVELVAILNEHASLTEKVRDLEVENAGLELMLAEADGFLAGKIVVDESENKALTEKVERLEEHGRNPTELAGRLYWFASEGDHVFDMDDGGCVVVQRHLDERASVTTPTGFAKAFFEANP